MDSPRISSARLLEVDAAANLALGALLVARPPKLLGLLGLPSAESPFYATVLGGLLSGIGLALLSTRLRFPIADSGLGLAGAVGVNLGGASALVMMLTRAGLDIPLRGRAILWLLVGFFVGLSGLELQSQGGKGDRPRAPEASGD